MSSHAYSPPDIMGHKKPSNSSLPSLPKPSLVLLTLYSAFAFCRLHLQLWRKWLQIGIKTSFKLSLLLSLLQLVFHLFFSTAFLLLQVWERVPLLLLMGLTPCQLTSVGSLWLWSVPECEESLTVPKSDYKIVAAKFSFPTPPVQGLPQTLI